MLYHKRSAIALCPTIDHSSAGPVMHLDNCMVLYLNTNAYSIRDDHLLQPHALSD